MPRSRIFLALGVLLVLTGCLGNPPQRVRVRRDAKVIDQEEQRIRPDAYAAWLTKQQEEFEARRLTPALKRERNYLDLGKLRVTATLESIPADPFASYEKDRLETLYRNWADDDEPPPEPESDVVAKAKAAEDEEGEDEDEGEDDDEGDDDEEDGDDEEEDEEDGDDEEEEDEEAVAS